MSSKPFSGDRQAVLIKDAIYTKYNLADFRDDDFAKFVLGGGGVDAYCKQCDQMSVFRLKSAEYNYEEKVKELPKYGVITIQAECNRDAENYHRKCSANMYFCFFRDGESLIKIGQYPSKADLDFGALDPVFSKELEPGLRQELGRAVGLRAHGVGVGSFVYLRRIFERLVEEAHNQARTEKEWDEEVYRRSRMPKRLKLLKQHLPSRLVKTAKLYDILSKGVHELSEEDCHTHYDLIQNAILMILKERHEEREYSKLVQEINQGAAQLGSQT